MSSISLAPAIDAAQLVLRCTDLGASIEFLTGRLGFKVRLIMPSDAPSVAVLRAHGCTLRLETATDGAPGPARLRLLCKPALLPAGTPAQLLGPDGLVVDLVDAHAPVAIPPEVQEFVLTRLGGPESWGVGRAGMLYRDLIPSRLNGRFVASHIRLPAGGPVPDYVHYHRVRFQVIFCKAGWVRLVYEDQGEPFILHAGDCVLQPPEIRHRVLESSAGAEVVELGCPAIHETHGDPEMTLPTGACLPQRLYQAQKFVRHVAATASWGPSRLAGFEARDTGIAWATEGLGGVRVLRPAAVPAPAAPDAAALGAPGAHGGEFLFFFVLAGRCELGSQALGQHALAAGDSCVLPAGADYRFSAAPGLELLEVSLPARLPAAGRPRPRT
jgi:quercetin dioxygenase-like cupin family protein